MGIKSLQASKEEKIVWPEHWNPADACNAPETTLVITVDGIHCCTGKPQHGTGLKNPQFPSHKFKQAGPDCKVATTKFENNEVCLDQWKNDVSAALKRRMGQGQLSVTDKGHLGKGDLLAVPTSHGMPEVREFESRALARHEKEFRMPQSAVSL